MQRLVKVHTRQQSHNGIVLSFVTVMILLSTNFYSNITQTNAFSVHDFIVRKDKTFKTLPSSHNQYFHQITDLKAHSDTSEKTIANTHDTAKQDGLIAEQNEISIPWLIVGGGIHGVHIAARILGSGAVNLDNICIIDANDNLLHTWKYRTATTGMHYLRSSAGYHLDLDENSLRLRFSSNPATENEKRSYSGTRHVQSRKRRKKKHKSLSKSCGVIQQEFSNDYSRPRLDIFNKHSDLVISKYKLDKIHQKGIVTGIHPCDENVQVEVQIPSATGAYCDDQSIIYTAEHIILALGNDDPSYVEWSSKDDIDSGLVTHLLDEKAIHSSENNDLLSIDTKTYDIAIVGGGITAAHKALELVDKKKNPGSESPSIGNIHLISRHPLIEQQFDTHQDWMMDKAASKRSEKVGGYGTPRRQRIFSKLTCWKERRMMIAKERVPGTVTPAVNRGINGLRYAIENGDIRWHQAEILDKKLMALESNHTNGNIAHYVKNHRIELSLSSGGKIETDKILLATGFGKKPPGGKLLDDLIENAGLEVSAFCGYPIVDQYLLWHPRIYVSGALAELELGPSARNIAGARLAAERILESFQKTSL